MKDGDQLVVLGRPASLRELDQAREDRRRMRERTPP